MLLHLLAELTPEQIKSLTDELVQKDFKWWFAAILIILLISGLYVFKYLINLIATERKASDDKTSLLIKYLQDDHVKSVAALEKFTDTIESLTSITEELGRIIHVQGIPIPPRIIQT